MSPTVWGVRTDKLEYRMGNEENSFAWEFEAWTGNDELRLVWKSEGAKIEGQGRSDEIGKSATHRIDPGIGQQLAGIIEEETGIGTVVQELAYLMRSGEPDALDRMVGFAFGGMAVQLLRDGEKGRMVALKDGNYCHVPNDCVVAGQKIVDVERLYDREAYRARIQRVEGMPMFLY